MEKRTVQILNNVNRAIIQFRGVYSEWSKRHKVSYNEMLVLYTIREFGYCTQKQICDNYLLPRQTINNVMTKMRQAGFLVLNRVHCEGREKAFSLTTEGERYAEEFLKSLNHIEEQAIEVMGIEKIAVMTELICEYNNALKSAMEQNN